MSFLGIRTGTTLWLTQRNAVPNLCKKPMCRIPASSRFFSTPIKYQPPNATVNGYKRFANNRPPFSRSRRFWVFAATGTVLFGGYYTTHLEKVPISGRMRFMSITPKQEEAMAVMAYKDVMQEFGRRILPADHPYTLFVKRVAKRLVQVSGLEEMKWEFYVIDSPERNAFVLPGGKVFVFTGILPVVQNEDGMAAVLGHEIAHQLARHSAEKIFGVDTAFLFNQFTMNFMMMSPFSRKCETEADVIGLQLMSQACFDPNESIEVWKRMSATDKHGVPQFMSTHPSHENRIQRLQKELPSALQKRADSDCSSEIGAFANMFREARVRW